MSELLYFIIAIAGGIFKFSTDFSLEAQADLLPAMPSKKKKKKSKGRGKAAKKADEQQRSLDTQMERLKIDKDGDSQNNADEDALLEEAINLAAAEKEEMDATAAEKNDEQVEVCHHGNVVETKELVFFINVFMRTACSYKSRARSLGEDESLVASFYAAIDAVVDKYPDVWYDPSKMKQVVSYFLYIATHHVLQGEFDSARLLATMASCFETFVASNSGEKISLDAKTTIIFELGKCDDEHTLVKYLKKRIPCSCLDEIYEEVKTTTRTGVCFNCSCTPERSKMLSCARCGNAHYCCRQCQKSHWPKHKENCGVFIHP